MASIEERAADYANKLLYEDDAGKLYKKIRRLCICAYLAGSEQTRQDYINRAISSREPFYPPRKQD